MVAPEATAAGKMAAYLSRLSPVPAFPEYTGPYKVGTMDAEMPVSDFVSPSPAPDAAADIPTVQFRVFYPAVPDSDEKHISWLPNPQRSHVSAYTKFIGISHTVAELLSFLPRHLYYTSIPVHKNAKLLEPQTENKRWPTMIFSHGLGGSRNSYSYIAGSLASHGIVVFCPEHRDGSAVASFIRVPGDSAPHQTVARRSIPYRKISHDVSPEVYEAREGQLRVRLWEMGLIYEAVLAVDHGARFTNMNQTTPSFDPFAGRLHVNDPGSVIFAGHSFGAATIFQLLKTSYYAEVPEVAATEEPLFTPAKDSSIRKQVTEKSVTMLLDMWCLPLLAPNSSPLFKLPLPAYADLPSSPGGTALLAVESEHFYKWKEHLHAKARLLSPDPTAKVVSADLFERPSGIKLPEPNFFYVINSAHLSQSDFGILFPWLTKKIFDAEQPERALRLNLRAQLQLLRANNVPVARTYAGDLVDGAHIDKLDATSKTDTDEASANNGLTDDPAIFDRSNRDIVDHWVWIDTIGLGEASEGDKGEPASQQVEAGEKELQGEMEPDEQRPPAAIRRLSTAVA